MKTVLVTLAILSSSIFNSIYAKGGLNLNEELKKVVKFNQSELPLEKEKEEFVKVSFKINEIGEVEVLEANYSDELIKTKLMKLLNKLRVEQEHDVNKVYYYNFTFKKV